MTIQRTTRTAFLRFAVGFDVCVCNVHCKKICVYPRIFCGEIGEIMKDGPKWARASLFRQYTDTNVCGTGFVKIWKTRHKISMDIRTFFTVSRYVCTFQFVSCPRRYSARAVRTAVFTTTISHGSASCESQYSQRAVAHDGEAHSAPLCRISWRLVNPLLRYGKLSFFSRRRPTLPDLD